MQLNIRKTVKWSILILFFSFLTIWSGFLLKNLVLTMLHGDEISNLNFYEPESVPNYDWFRITDYSETEIKVYFVEKISHYEVGGVATYSCNPYGNWFHQDAVSWSTAGTADTLIWPYWYHIVYYMF